MTDFFAITTRGLEPVVQAELANTHTVKIREQAYRRVHASLPGNLGRLLAIRTADDIFVEVATWEDIRHTRDMLPEFTQRSADLYLETAVVAIRSVRQISDYATFSISANFVGKRNYNYKEIQAAVSEGILQSNPDWLYMEDDQDALLNVRIFIEHDRALIGVRLTETPMHRRAYKQNSLAGSLRAPVGAAMIQLAELKKGQTLLDPFCGSGTIVLEAALQGINAIGSDNDSEALAISQENAANIKGDILLEKWDARQLPLDDDSVHAVVSNLPWGRQVEVNESLQLLYEQAFAEMQRVTVTGGKLVLLTTLPELIPEKPERSFEISVHGQNPNILVF